MVPKLLPKNNPSSLSRKITTSMLIQKRVYLLAKSEFGLFFGRSFETIICFRNLLTFKYIGQITVEISQKFVAFSKYMNFNLIFLLPYILSSLFAFFSFLSCLRKHEKIQQNRCFLSGRVKGELYS